MLQRHAISDADLFAFTTVSTDFPEGLGIETLAFYVGASQLEFSAGPL